MLRLSTRRRQNRLRLSICRSLFSANEPNQKHRYLAYAAKLIFNYKPSVITHVL